VVRLSETQSDERVKRRVARLLMQLGPCGQTHVLIIPTAAIDPGQGYWVLLANEYTK